MSENFQATLSNSSTLNEKYEEMKKSFKKTSSKYATDSAKWHKLNLDVREFCLELTKSSKLQTKKQPKSALKSKRGDKADAKTEAKRKNGVKFSSEVDFHVIGERRWNDYKARGAIFKKGNFTTEEIKTLMHALCTYVK